MGQKIAILAVAICFLLIIPLATCFSDVEDSVRVKAAVIGFGEDTAGQSLITLRVDEILSYIKAEGSDPPELTSNSTLTFGYLWGHRQVNGTFQDLLIGSTIIGNISLHHPFSSHVGHLYGYELVCGEYEILTDKGCVPGECPTNEVLVGTKCIPLDCGPFQGYRNHACYELDCETDEKVENHRCVGVACADDELASNHFCQKLDCGIDSIAKNHECVQLVCGVFKKAGNHTCVLDWSQLAAFVAVTFVVLYLIYVLLIQDLFSEKKKGERALANRMGMFLVFLVSFVVLALPAVSRLIFHSNLLIGPESYHTQLIARGLMEGTLKLSLGGEITLYHLLLAYLGGLFGLENMAHLLPILLGTFSATIFYLIMRRIIDDVRTSTLTTMVMIFSPAFLYLFSVSTPHSLVALLLLIGVFLSLSSRKASLFSGGLLLALVSTYDPFVFALSFAAYLLILINTQNNRRLRISLLALIILAGLIFSLFFHTYNAEPIVSFRQNFIDESITDFGGKAGFGLFHIILLFSGLLYTWKKKKDYAPLYILLSLLFALMLALDTNYNVYLNFGVSYFIGFALSRFAEAKWETQQLKNIAILILFCGLLFSTVSYAKRMSLMEPEQQLTAALTKLSEYPKGNVLSIYPYSDIIAYFARMPPYIPVSGSDALMKKNIADEVFYSRKLDTTQNILLSEGIRYILVDRGMRQGGIWERDDEGLLFLFNNQERFKRILGNEARVGIWEYMPQNASLGAG